MRVDDSTAVLGKDFVAHFFHVTEQQNPIHLCIIQGGDHGAVCSLVRTVGFAADVLFFNASRIGAAQGTRLTVIADHKNHLSIQSLLAQASIKLQCRTFVRSQDGQSHHSAIRKIA